MNKNQAIEEYQCAGCVVGSDTECVEYEKDSDSCSKHVVGTLIMPVVGRIFLGMPVGFNRLGEQELPLKIFHSFDFMNENGYGFDYLNVPVWRYLNKEGHTLVRGYRPRINDPFLFVILEDCMDKIDCFEMTHELMKGMN